ncbi:MAG: DUF523 domain-containing protein [Planctomycetota bacterium]
MAAETSPTESREPVLVSACLLGTSCTYKASHNRDAVLLADLAAQGLRAVPFCPEEHGGLATPRPAADLSGSADAVLSGAAEVRTVDTGDDVTDAFLRGAQGALETCQRLGIRRAFLKERSPSCGCESTHQSGELVRGPGVTTALLRAHEIECTGVEGRRSS